MLTLEKEEKQQRDPRMYGEQGFMYLGGPSIPINESPIPYINSWKEKTKKKVYIIYRYNDVNAGKVLANIGVAYRVAFDLIKEGYIPYIPHSDCLLAIMFGHRLDLQFYYDYSIEWQKACESVCVVYDGQELSEGCKKEVELAEQLNQEIITKYVNLEKM